MSTYLLEMVVCIGLTYFSILEIGFAGLFLGLIFFKLVLIYNKLDMIAVSQEMLQIDLLDNPNQK